MERKRLSPITNQPTLTSWPGSHARRNHKIIMKAALVEQSPPGMGGFCNTEKEDKRSAMLRNEVCKRWGSSVGVPFLSVIAKVMVSA